MKKFKRMFLIAGLIWGMANPNANATPPYQMNLSYDDKQQRILVDLKHPSQEMAEHFIRKLIVTKNNESPHIHYFSRQPRAYQFTLEVPLKAEPGDRITVQAFCKEGGTKEAAMTVQEKEESKTIINSESAPHEITTTTKGMIRQGWK